MAMENILKKSYKMQNVQIKKKRDSTTEHKDQMNFIKSYKMQNVQIKKKTW